MMKRFHSSLFLLFGILFWFSNSNIIALDQKMEILPFPVYKSSFPLDPKEANSYLRFLSLNEKICDEGKIGTKIALIGYGPVQLSTLAFINLWMYPENMKFNVDHFLAALGLGFDMKLSRYFFLSLYPLYHESAHLADGYKGDLASDKKIFSVESFQTRLWFERGLIQIPLRIDYYWHTAGPQWKYNIGTGIKLAVPLWNVLNSSIFLEISAFGYALNEDNIVKFNGEFEEGLLIRNADRKLRFDFTYGYEYGLGQNWNTRERSWGLDIGFGW